MNKEMKLILKSVFVLILCAVSFQVLASWSTPSLNAPEGNTEAPINVGTDTQYKPGSIISDGLRTAYSFITDPGSISTFNGATFFNSDASFRWDGDPATGSMKIDSANDRVLFNGLVGIGTLVPAYKLDVNGDVNVTGNFKVNGTNISTGGSSQWTTTGSDIYYNTGKVGVGTTNPVGTFQVDLPAFSSRDTNSQQAIFGSAGNGIRMGYSSTNNIGIINTLKPGVAWGSLVLQDGGGNVGIGTTTPGAKLEVNGQVKITGGTPGLGKVLTSDASGLATWETISSSGITGSGTDNYVVKFSNGGLVVADSSIVDSAGKIGVGTNTPGNLLTVNQTGNTTAATQSTYGLSVGIAGSHQITMGADATNAYIQSWNSKPLYLNSQGNNVVFGSGAILASGAAGTTPTSGAGTRMMWVPAKSAFRAGYVNGTQWDDANVGLYSTAMGINTKASNVYSTAIGYGATATGDVGLALGYFTTASGSYSVAMGDSSTASGPRSFSVGGVASGGGSVALGGGASSGTQSVTLGGASSASGNWSTAMGRNTIASASESTAMGSSTTASGWYSSSMGNGTKAESYASTAIGRWNVGGGNPTTWVLTDPLFEIGNGISSNTNAFTVYKNGNALLAGTLTQSSSRRYKTDIENYQIDKTKVLGLNPSIYVYKTDTDKVKQIGLIAEDVAKIVPEIVSYDKEGRPDSLNYSALSVIVLDLVKQQQKEIDLFKKESILLKQEIDILKQEVELLKNK